MTKKYKDYFRYCLYPREIEPEDNVDIYIRDDYCSGIIYVYNLKRGHSHETLTFDYGSQIRYLKDDYGRFIEAEYKYASDFFSGFKSIAAYENGKNEPLGPDESLEIFKKMPLSNVRYADPMINSIECYRYTYSSYPVGVGLHKNFGDITWFLIDYGPPHNVYKVERDWRNFHYFSEWKRNQALRGNAHGN